MKTKILQTYRDLRSQPVIAWVTLLGTTLSMFLFMTVLMTEQIKFVPFAPESNRSRIVYGMNYEMKAPQYSSSSYLGFEEARAFYDNLEGVEIQSWMECDADPGFATSGGGAPIDAESRYVDSNYWKIFDHKLVDGRWFNEHEAQALTNSAVLTESLARKLFGTDKAAGMTFEYNLEPRTVVGVVKDVSPLASQTYAELYLPLNHADTLLADCGIKVAMILASGSGIESLRSQVEGRYATENTRLKPDSIEYLYHGQPYDLEQVSYGPLWSNGEPDPAEGKRKLMYTYLILLLVPAINLSSMLNSRLRQRVSEFGIRRAYGCSRLRIITDVLWENMLVTLAGGIVGILLAMILAFIAPAILAPGDMFSPSYSEFHLSLGMILNWRMAGFALLACFILNIISASVPAWRASRVTPIDAISARNA